MNIKTIFYITLFTLCGYCKAQQTVFVEPISLTPNDVREHIELPEGWQKVRFSFVSNGYYAKSPNGHFGVVLNNDDGYMEYIGGLGIISGHVAKATNGCPNPNSMQIEKFYIGGNTLYPETCTEGLLDGVRYDVELYHTPEGFSYSVYDVFGYKMGSAKIDESNYFGDSLYFFEVFGVKCEDWSIDFYNISVNIQ